jgi:LAO/AO transport system kinase
LKGFNLVKPTVSQSDQIGNLLKAAKSDSKAFARLLTLVERLGVESLREAELLTAQRAAFRVGITGPPGAGKSTLVSRILQHLKGLELKIGVLAVDPSSPFSKGAILGDRIRYSEHFLDPHIFIRSLGTRGSLGGLSGSAYLMLRAFDACEFDIVLIETVGVGQSELDVLNVADQICVVLVPESGDSVQALKAGLLEIADVFVVNKADRPGAASLVRELESAQLMKNQVVPQILQTVATRGDGVEQLTTYLTTQMKSAQPRRQDVRAMKEECKALLRIQFEAEIERRTADLQTPMDLRDILLGPQR